MTFPINLLDALAILACSRMAFAVKAYGGVGVELSDIGASAENFASRRVMVEELGHDVCASYADDDEIALLQIHLRELDAPTRENTLELLRVRSLEADVLSPKELRTSANNAHAVSDEISSRYQRYRQLETDGKAESSYANNPLHDLSDLFPHGNIPFPHGWFSWEKWDQLNSSLSEKVETWTKENRKKVNDTSPEALQRVAAFKNYVTTSPPTTTAAPTTAAPTTAAKKSSNSSMMQEALAVAVADAPHVKFSAVKDLARKAAATVSNRADTVATSKASATLVFRADSAKVSGKSTAAKRETSAASPKDKVSQISNRVEAPADANLESLLEDIMDTTTKK